MSRRNNSTLMLIGFCGKQKARPSVARGQGDTLDTERLLAEGMTQTSSPVGECL
jgi:hypothetical protein